MAATLDPPKRKNRSLVFVFIVLVLAAAVFLVRKELEIDPVTEKQELPEVRIQEIEPDRRPVELILPSSAQAWHVTPIWSRVNGYLIRYLVDIGDAVKKGEVLAEIDTPETDQELAQAQADLKNAKVERDIAKITNDRWQRLWNKNREAVPKQEVDQYHANYRSAEALVTANEKNVARLMYQQQFKFIHAPFDGIITQRLIDIGSLIYGTVNGTAQELFQLADSHILRFFVEVPQTNFRQIKEGLKTDVTVQEFPNRTFEGTVTRYAKALDPVARTLLTEVDVENKERFLYPGIYGEVKFTLPPDTLQFIIPGEAIIIHAGLPHVAVVDRNEIVHLKRVEIGLDKGKEVQIISGLSPKDRVITNPSSQIREGTRVKIMN